MSESILGIVAATLDSHTSTTPISDFRIGDVVLAFSLAQAFDADGY